LAHDGQIHRFGELDQLGRVAVGQSVPFAVYAGDPEVIFKAKLGPVGDLGFVKNFGDRPTGARRLLCDPGHTGEASETGCATARNLRLGQRIGTG
jgi:hypothetical protein